MMIQVNLMKKDKFMKFFRIMKVFHNQGRFPQSGKFSPIKKVLHNQGSFS